MIRNRTTTEYHPVKIPTTILLMLVSIMASSVLIYKESRSNFPLVEGAGIITPDMLTGSNVKDHGAKGDAVSDDRTAISNCIKSLKDDTGTIYFPAGEYRIADSFRIPKGVQICFEVGAVINVAQGKVLYIDGEIYAGDHQIFKGSISGTPVNISGNPWWFGAKGDGNSNDSEAFNKALAVFKQVDIPFTEKGYAVSGIMVKSRQIIQGRGEKKVILKGIRGSADVIIIKGSDVIVRNLDFDMINAPDANCIRFDNTSAAIEKCKVSDIRAVNARCVITDSDSDKLVITTNLERIECVDGRGTALVLNDFWGFIFLTDISVEYTSAYLKSSALPDKPAIYVKDNAGMIIRNLTIKGGGPGASDNGIHFHDSVAVWAGGLDIEAVGGTGVLFSGYAEHFYIRDSKISDSGQYGMYMTANYLQMHDVAVSGSGKDGIRFAGQNFQLSKIQSEDNSGHGLYCISLRFSALSNITVNRNGGYGVYDDGNTNSYYSIAGSGNRSGSYNSNVSLRLFSS